MGDRAREPCMAVLSRGKTNLSRRGDRVDPRRGLTSSDDDNDDVKYDARRGARAKRRETLDERARALSHHRRVGRPLSSSRLIAGRLTALTWHSTKHRLDGGVGCPLLLLPVFPLCPSATAPLSCTVIAAAGASPSFSVNRISFSLSPTEQRSSSGDNTPVIRPTVSTDR